MRGAEWLNLNMMCGLMRTGARRDPPLLPSAERLRHRDTLHSTHTHLHNLVGTLFPHGCSEHVGTWAWNCSLYLRQSKMSLSPALQGFDFVGWEMQSRLDWEKTKNCAIDFRLPSNSFFFCPYHTTNGRVCTKSLPRFVTQTRQQNGD